MASSQETGRSGSPLAARMRGAISRSGAESSSAAAHPLRHRPPRFVGNSRRRTSNLAGAFRQRHSALERAVGTMRLGDFAVCGRHSPDLRRPLFPYASLQVIGRFLSPTCLATALAGKACRPRCYGTGWLVRMRVDVPQRETQVQKVSKRATAYERRGRKAIDLKTGVPVHGLKGLRKPDRGCPRARFFIDRRVAGL